MVKEKKIKNIQSVYVPDEDIPTVEALEVIRWREHKSMSEMIILAMKEYAENHKDGNSQFKIDDPIYAAPVLMRPFSTWKSYFQSLNDGDESRFKFKLQELNGLFNERFGYSP